MHHEGADGPVVARNSGNAEGAKGSDSRAMAMSQPDLGEDCSPTRSSCDVDFGRVRSTQG